MILTFATESSSPRQKRRACDKEGHGETDACQCRRTDELGPLHPFRHKGEPDLHGQPGEETDTNRLSHDQAEEDAKENWSPHNGGDITRDLDPGICQGEDRQHQIRRPGRQGVLQSLGRCLHALSNPFECMCRSLLPVGRVHQFFVILPLINSTQYGRTLRQKGLCSYSGPRRNRQGKQGLQRWLGGYPTPETPARGKYPGCHTEADCARLPG